MFPVLVMSSSLDTNLVTLNRRPNSLSHKCFPMDWMTALAHWRASTTFYLANQRGRFSMLSGEAIVTPRDKINKTLEELQKSRVIEPMSRPTL